MALVFNGTSNYAQHPIVPQVGGNAFSIACTFKTGSTVTGAAQYPVHINTDVAPLRGWGIEIDAAGAIKVWRNAGSFSYSASLGTAVANTIYRVVLTKASGSGICTAYLNAIGITGSSGGGAIANNMTRIITGALSSSGVSGFFGGKIARVAFWTSVLSSADITYCLTDGNLPTGASVAPASFWQAISDDLPTIGVSNTARTGATYDSDVLGSYVGYTIASVNGGNPVKMGASFNTTTTGYTSVSSATLGGYALTGLSFGSNTLTATAPTLTDGVAIYEPDTTQTLSITDGSHPYTYDITAYSPNGMTSVVVDTPNLLDNTFLGYWMASLGYTPVNLDRFVYTTADCTVGADGEVTTATPKTTTIWLWQNSGDVARSFTVTIGEGGVIVSVFYSGLSAIGFGLGFGI